MPDITMCKGTDCPLKETCYRYSATPNDHQSYFTEVPVKDGKCDMYWGESTQNIYDQLIEIFKPNKDEDTAHQ